MSQALAVQQVMRDLVPEINSSSLTTSSAAGLLASSSPDTDEARHNRKLWFFDLIARFESLRKLKGPSPLECAMMLAELDAARYTHAQATLAEMWILYGDWRYEGVQAQLKLSDFYPDQARVQYLLDQRDIVVMRREAYQAKIRAARQSGAEQERGKVTRDPDETSRRYADALLEVVRLKAELSDAREEIERLTAARNRLPTIQNEDRMEMQP